MIILHQHDPKGYGARATELIDAGYIPIPCQGKKPSIPGWPQLTASKAKEFTEQHGDSNVGIVLGDTVLVADIDIKDNATAAKEVAQRVQEVLGAGALISRTGVTSTKIFYRTETPIKKRALDLKHG